MKNGEGIKVVKIGGNVVDSEESLKAFCRDFASLEGRKILVHGGGAVANRIQEALGQEPVRIEGRRVTDEETLKVVTMVYSGWCNKHIVALLQAYGCNAIGLSGCDGSVITAGKRPPRTLSDGITKVDFGYVGDVTPDSVNAGQLRAFVDAGLTPVLCAINHDGAGQLLNTNADTVASSVAAALRSDLICCFELDGVLTDRNDPSSVIGCITGSDFAAMKANGTVADGMIPKIENALDALNNGASSVIIKNAARISDSSGTRIEK